MKLKTLLVGAVAGLLLTACGGGASPEDVTKDFVNALATGDCEKALGMAVENAKETVQSTLDGGCEEYQSEVVSVNCETTEDASTCACVEKRDGESMTYDYDLKKVDGAWKVTNFQKQMNMDGMGDLQM